MTTFRDLPALGAAINRESYEWLTDNLPWLADALRSEVSSGATPAQVRQFVMRQTQRPALALRLEQAAAYLAAQKVAQ